MPRQCALCARPDRAELDRLLISGEASNRRIAARCDVSESSVRRHVASHIPGELAKAREVHEQVRADDLLGRLLELNRETMAILSEAREGKAHDIALKAIARAEKQIEIQGELLGELNRAPQVNVLLSPDWARLRTLILRALEPHGDARSAVIAALSEVAGA